MPWCLNICLNVEIDSWGLNLRSRSSNFRYIKSFSFVRKELQDWASYKYDVLSFNDINVVARLIIISIYFIWKLQLGLPNYKLCKQSMIIIWYIADTRKDHYFSIRVKDKGFTVWPWDNQIYSRLHIAVSK